MSSSTFLREDIKEVFSIFDEDGAGIISMQEAGRALYTITGQRVSRSELLKLISYAQGAVAKLQQIQQNQNGAQTPQHCLQTISTATPNSVASTTIADQDTEPPGIAEPLNASQEVVPASPTAVSPESTNSRTATNQIPKRNSSVTTSPSAAGPRRQTRFIPPRSLHLDSSEGIDVDVFEQVVLRKLQHRSYEEELAYTFALLEDKSYLGFITKESVRRAAVETGEPLTEAEIAEMFDPLVTGVPTAAVDLSTFTDVQIAARKAEGA